jgi:hypothetical protein
MVQVTRRILLSTAAASGCCACWGVEHAYSKSLSDVGGCALIGSDADLLDERKIVLSDRSSASDQFRGILRSTGNHTLDIAFDRALKRISDTFGVTPGFGFYDDSDSPNAWAMPRSLIPQTAGTILFGRQLFSTLLDIDDSGISIIQVSAHEFGHIQQYASGKYEQIGAAQPTSKRIELHADFVSGYYLGLLKVGHPDASLWKAGQKIYEFGDYGYNNPRHHGTPEQRVMSAEAGFKLSYFQKKDFDYAFRAGIDYVSDK